MQSGRSMRCWCCSARRAGFPAPRAVASAVSGRPETLPRAIAWSSSAFQIAVIAGPALGGFLYVLGPAAAYASAALAFLGRTSGIRHAGRAPPCAPRDGGLRSRACRKALPSCALGPVVLGAISLDLFAVLLGGATRTAARLCARHPAYRTGRPRPVAQRAAVGPPQSFALARRPLERHDGTGDVRRRRSVRHRDNRFRSVAQFLLLASRCWRCSARPTWSASISASADSVRDARCDARAGECGQPAVHRRVERARRI